MRGVVSFRCETMLELESVHVPKTAGITFLEILRHWYGPQYVAAHTSVLADAITFDTKVMHGHFPAGTYRAKQRIAWVREPAARIISHYFYMRYDKQPGHPGTSFYDMHCRLVAGQISLDEWVHDEFTLGSTKRWFHGLALDEFDFVGIQEDFDRDLIRCAVTLRKPVITIDGRENVTVAPEYAAFKRDMDPALIGQIRDLNPECVELYDEALERAATWWRQNPGIEQSARAATGQALMPDAAVPSLATQLAAAS